MSKGKESSLHVPTLDFQVDDKLTCLAYERHFPAEGTPSAVNICARSVLLSKEGCLSEFWYRTPRDGVWCSIESNRKHFWLHIYSQQRYKELSMFNNLQTFKLS